MVLPATETVLSALSGTSEQERVLIVLCSTAGANSHIELRQQSFGDGVGWFTQSTIALEPHQVAELRSALGTGGQGIGRRSVSAKSLPREFSQVSIVGFAPRVVHADSA